MENNKLLQQKTFPTLIAEATQTQGDITTFASTYIYGVIEGNVTQNSLEAVHVGGSGWVCGNIISMGPVFVEGRVDGSIISETRIELGPCADVCGSLEAPGIKIRAGARLNGQARTTKERKKLPQLVEQAA